jgi:predicted RNA-binding protein with PUA-like domain
MVEGAALAYWLLKTEPSTYSWADLVRDKKATWDGVANPTALIHLRAMKAGDQAFIYHTGSERAAVGIAKVTKGGYPDPKQDNEKLAVVDLEPVKALAQPVTLDQIKADKAFAGWDLLRIGRLSVVPTSKQMWDRIVEMSKGK